MSRATWPHQVLHLNTETGWRGGERQALWLAEQLRGFEWGSTFLVPAASPLHARARAAGFPVRDLPARASLNPLAWLRIGGIVQSDAIDVVHAHTGKALTIAVLAQRGRAALVGTKRVDRPAHGPFTRWKYRRADMMTVISEHLRRVVLRDGAPPDRIAVVPDGVDTTRAMAPASRDALGALGVRGDGPLVVMVAALVPTKAPEVFVRAVAAARRRGAQCEGLLVGDGELRALVEQERHREGAESFLHLAGWRDDTDALIGAADIVALTSRGEGQGSVLLDAMLAGKPVVATTAGGIPEVIIEGKGGLLSPVDDAEALGASIGRLVADAALRRRMGEFNRARVADYSLARYAARTVHVYEAALRRRRA